MIRHGSARFVGIPEYFLLRYSGEIDGWARNIRKIGLVKSIVLREGIFADPSPNEEHGAQLLAVRLICRPYAAGVEISPLTELDSALIARHCEKLERLKIPAGMVLVEPDRPWVPFVPEKVWAP